MLWRWGAPPFLISKLQKYTTDGTALITNVLTPHTDTHAPAESRAGSFWKRLSGMWSDVMCASRELRRGEVHSARGIVEAAAGEAGDCLTERHTRAGPWKRGAWRPPGQPWGVTNCTPPSG